MTGVLTSGGRDRETHEGRRPCENGGRNWSYAVINKPRKACSHQKLRRGKKDSFLEPSEIG